MYIRWFELYANRRAQDWRVSLFHIALCPPVQLQLSSSTRTLLATRMPLYIHSDIHPLPCPPIHESINSVQVQLILKAVNAEVKKGKKERSLDRKARYVLGDVESRGRHIVFYLPMNHHTLTSKALQTSVAILSKIGICGCCVQHIIGTAGDCSWLILWWSSQTVFAVKWLHHIGLLIRPRTGV